MTYSHKVTVKEIPVPAGSIEVKIESDVGKYTGTHQMYATPQEFLACWKELVEHYERVKNANSIQN